MELHRLLDSLKTKFGRVPLPLQSQLVRVLGTPPKREEEAVQQSGFGLIRKRGYLAIQKSSRASEHQNAGRRKPMIN